MASDARVSLGLVAAIVGGGFVFAHSGCGDSGSDNKVTDASATLDGSKAGTDATTTPAADGSTTPTTIADGSPVTTSDGSPVTTSDANATLSDGAIGGVMIEADNGTVALGNLAPSRAQDAAVRAFAQRMVKEHSDASARLIVLLPRLGISPADSDVRRTLQASTQATTTQLSALNGAAFDAAYVQSQVDRQQQVLRLLDEALIPSAHNGELKAELASVRATASMNLDAAKGLSSGGGGTTDGGVTADAASTAADAP